MADTASLDAYHLGSNELNSDRHTGTTVAIHDNRRYCSINLTRSFMTKLSEIVARNLSAVFGQRDGKKRRASLKEFWSADAVLWSSNGTYMGYKAIEQAAAVLLRKYPEFDFSFVGDSNEIPGAALMRWSFGVPGSSPAITGMDVVVVSQGGIVAVYRFLDGAEL